MEKKDNYIVNYVETRPTKLNGTININACLKEINQTKAEDNKNFD